MPRLPWCITLVNQHGELQMLVSVFDIGELLSSLQKIHVPAGVNYWLTLKPNVATQTRSVLHSPSSTETTYHYQTTEKWWSGIWDFDWYVQSDFMGGVDLTLMRSVRWGGGVALLLLGALALVLLEYARRLLLVMRQRQEIQKALVASEQRLMAIANQLPGVSIVAMQESVCLWCISASQSRVWLASARSSYWRSSEIS